MSGRHRLALTGLLVGLAAVMVAWLLIDRRPPEWDHANHLERAVACHRSLAAPGRDWLQEIIAESSFYPPIVTCAAGLLYFALPIVPLTAQAVIWAFLVVGTLAVFGLRRRLLDADAGLLAAFLFATAPFVGGRSGWAWCSAWACSPSRPSPRISRGRSSGSRGGGSERPSAGPA